MDKVRIDDNGFVCKSSNCNQKEGSHSREKPDKHESFVSHSHRIADVATTIGVHPIMKNSQEETKVSFRHGEYKSSPDSPNPKYDGRCHPYWIK